MGRKKERLKVYIAGRVSGLPYEEVRANFARHAAYVRRAWGHQKPHIVLPTVICRPEWSWWHCMRVCLRALRTCDVAYFMPNWKQSRGARIEYFFAKVWGLGIIK
mgnify:CR=1 FL=1